MPNIDEKVEGMFNAYQPNGIYDNPFAKQLMQDIKQPESVKTEKPKSSDTKFQEFLKSMKIPDKIDDVLPPKKKLDETGDVKQLTYDFLTNEGFTKEQATGIMGNMMTESRFNPNAVGDKGTSFGMFQHHNERWDNLKKFAESLGTTANNPLAQLKYTLHELKTTHKGAYQKLLQSKTPEEAAKVFAINFEKMKTYEPIREKYARNFYNTL